MPDENGYPTRAELTRVRALAHGSDHRATIEYVQSIWWHSDWGIRAGKLVRDSVTGAASRRWDVSTGGWSGNEEIIAALERGSKGDGRVPISWFWIICWTMSRRGGHYTFVVPEEPL